MKNLSDYTDMHGFIGQKLRDGSLEFGDAGQRTPTDSLNTFVDIEASNLSPQNNELAHKRHAAAIQTKITRIQKTTGDSRGKVIVQLVRHWDHSKWYGQLWCGSRDNTETWFMLMGLYGNINLILGLKIKRLLNNLTARHGRLWNYKRIAPGPFDEPKLPDFILPWDLAMYKIRCLSKCGWFKPWNWLLLCIYDLDTVANSLIRVFKSYTEPDETNSDLNHINRLVFKQIIYNNPTVWLAKWIYKLFRRNPIPIGGKRMQGYVPLNVFKHQYRKWDDPPMDVVCEPMIRKYI